MTPAWIEPATFRFVAQYLNHCDTAVPYKLTHAWNKKLQTLQHKDSLRVFISKNYKILPKLSIYIHSVYNKLTAKHMKDAFTPSL